jgi:hypothetical protein
LEKRAEHILPGREGLGEEGGGREQGGEMTQTMYAHLNIWVKKKKERIKTVWRVLKT